MFQGNESVLIAYLTAGLATFALTPVAARLAMRTGAVDHPNERKLHKRPLPTSGGVAIAIGFIVGVLVVMWGVQGRPRAFIGVVVGALLVAVVGYIDDHVDIPAKFKLGLQLLCVAPLLASGVTINMLSHPLIRGEMIVLPVWLAWTLTTLWVVGVTNAMNLIDGLDGLASGVAAIACVALAFIALMWGQLLVAVFCAGLAGAAMGFLPWNWHPAKILMGDTGAYFLGFIIAGVTIQGAFKMAAAIAILVPVLVLAVPLLDTVLSPLRRLLSGRPIFGADREHLHHRLMAMGLSDTRVVLLTYTVTAVCGAIAIWISRV